jgi:hypothetical protein
MASAINDETAAQLDWTPHDHTVVHDPIVPRHIKTEATEWAPEGHIVDDSARGTIFWEATTPTEELPPATADEREADAALEEEFMEDNEDAETEARADSTKSTSSQPHGRPFRVEWISTSRLPFYRTRGLRNPWNANREVKIARDGTELETSVGRRLTQMFHQPMPVAPRSQHSPQGFPQHSIMGYGGRPSY